MIRQGERLQDKTIPSFQNEHEDETELSDCVVYKLYFAMIDTVANIHSVVCNTSTCSIYNEYDWLSCRAESLQQNWCRASVAVFTRTSLK